MIPRKATLISTGLLSLAIILKLSLPVVADFATTELPLLYTCFLTWVQPPYVYLLMNCIIISIVASSKFQLQKGSEEKEPSSSRPVVVAGDEVFGVVLEKEDEEKKEEKVVSASSRFDVSESEKMTVEVVKIPEPKELKAITNGGRKPLTKHLKKSDTWNSRVRGDDVSPKPKMGKSESFSGDPPTSYSEGGLTRGEMSLSQDELNRRVEEFIKKFNDEMRLQRQASLDRRYNNEVVGEGAF